MTKILFVSLGCDKNLVDSEVMISLLTDNGYEITNDENEAEVCVVNTCCFIGDAKEESIENIIELGKLKETAKLKALIVTGCLTERYREDVFAELPEVDACLGTMAVESIVEAVQNVMEGKRYEKYESLSYLPRTGAKRSIPVGTYTGYLKIAEGCDKRCTYCIIPYVRGSFRSVPMEDVIESAKYLVDNGIREICLVAQETTLYGKDLYGEKSLHILLRKLSEIEELKWIRILYCYPEEIYDKLIYEIRDNKKVCHYIDMPLQHASDNILRLMGRKTTNSDIREKIAKLKSEVPDIVLRTTLIAGFPGETDEDHEELLEFIDEIEFDRLGVFTYSPEEGTVAAKMDCQISEDIKEKYRDEIMALQQEISYDKNEKRVGKELEVIVDGYIYKDDMYACRSYMDAPDIDGMVFVKSETELVTGDFIKVRITDFNEYDLIGEMINEAK